VGADRQALFFQRLAWAPHDAREIKALVQMFVDGARYAVDAGIDGLELHSGNGYVFTQFISSAINDRNDEYGGPLENRFRFWREVIEGIRTQPATRNVPLIAKLSVREGDDAVFAWRSSGNSLEESAKVAKWCVEAGADAIHVTAGSIFPHPWNPAGYLPVDFVPRTYKTLIDSGTKTWRRYLVFRYGLTRPIARWLWERTIWKELYSSKWNFLIGRQRPWRKPESGWRNLEGINAPRHARSELPSPTRAFPCSAPGRFRRCAAFARRSRAAIATP
jgi:NADH:flavin oxidoreductase/NADH oxidase family protein